MARTTIPAELVAINAIQGTLIADNAITAVHIATNAVSGTLVADNAITSTHIAQNNVTATQIAMNTITVTQLADSAVETAKLNNDAVTQAKIADDAVGADQLAANSVVSASIVNGSIVEADMADNAVTLAKMASLARGSIIYGDSAGDPAALSIGSNGTVLKSDGTDISWGTVSGGTALDDITTGDAESTLATSTGSIILDSPSAIKLDADGGEVQFKDGGTEIGVVSMSSQNMNIESKVADKDIVFKGIDGSSDVTALTLDMSDAGTAIFNHDIKLGDDDVIKLGDTAGDFEIYHIAGSINVVRGSGGLVLQTDDTSYGIQMGSYSGGETMFKAVKNGEVSLYHDNAVHFNTYANGTQSGNIYFKSTGSDSQIEAGNVHFKIAAGIWMSGSSSLDLQLQVPVTGVGISTAAKLDAPTGDWYTNDGSVSSLSDSRLKKDITTLTDGIDIVKQLRPVTFKYDDSSLEEDGSKTLGANDTTRYGFVAQEVETVAPQYVVSKEGKVKGETVSDLKSLSQTRMIPMLVKAIQELEARIKTLEG